MRNLLRKLHADNRREATRLAAWKDLPKAIRRDGPPAGLVGDPAPRFMFSSLQSRMGALFVAFFLLTTISVGATIIAMNTQKQDALIVNIAGRQRMLIQGMAKDALELARGNARAAELNQKIDLFDATLTAFMQSGSLSYGSNLTSQGTSPANLRTVTFPPAADPTLVQKLQALRARWDDLRSHLDILMRASPTSPAFITALEAVEQLAPELVYRSDEVVRYFEFASEQKVIRLQWIQISFLVIALALLAVSSVLTHQQILGPLKHLANAAQRMGRGDLETPVAVHGAREITILGHRFNEMRSQLRASQLELKAWAQELEARVAQQTRELLALHEVSREISSQLEIDQVLRSVTDKARELLGGDVAALCLLDESGENLTLHALSGPQELRDRNKTPVQGMLINLVGRGASTQVCNLSGVEPGCFIARQYRASHIAASLRVGERIIGALCVGSGQAHYFSPTGEQFLSKLANSAAIALENARLYEQAERLATLEERQRIAAEMHDGLAQTLSYLKLQVEQAAEHIQRDQDTLALSELQRATTALEQATLEVHRTIASLQEGPLPRLALQERLARLVNELAHSDSIKTEWAIQIKEPLYLSSDVSEQILGIVREAVQNAYRHAQPQHIVVGLERANDQVIVRVQDDGRGFDPHAPLQDGVSHFGLTIMRARAARIGGELTVHSAPGQGTQISLSWQMPESTSSAVRS